MEGASAVIFRLLLPKGNERRKKSGGFYETVSKYLNIQQVYIYIGISSFKTQDRIIGLGGSSQSSILCPGGWKSILICLRRYIYSH